VESVTWPTKSLVGFLILVTVKDQLMLAAMFERGKLFIVIIPVDAIAVQAAKVFCWAVVHYPSLSINSLGIVILTPFKDVKACMQVTENP
jgi:hypothetical protein